MVHGDGEVGVVSEQIWGVDKIRGCTVLQLGSYHGGCLGPSCPSVTKQVTMPGFEPRPAPLLQIYAEYSNH
jgi:hypothetical protein